MSKHLILIGSVNLINKQTYHKHKQVVQVNDVINLLLWLWTLNRQTDIFMYITLTFLKLSNKFYCVQAAEIIKRKMLSKRITFIHQIKTNFLKPKFSHSKVNHDLPFISISFKKLWFQDVCNCIHFKQLDTSQIQNYPEILKPKTNKDPCCWWKFHDFFYHPMEISIPCCCFYPWKTHLLFFWLLLEIPYPQPPKFACVCFFQDSSLN